MGVWLSTGLLAAAVYWMLRGWLPGRWALLGAILVVFHFGIQFYWGQSFWGGNVAMIGGALLYGALPRIMRRARTADALLMALGLAILANSRPYEGLVASLPAALALAVWLVGRNRPPLAKVLPRVVLPMVAALAITAVWMGYYNAQVTGSPSKWPYQVYQHDYLKKSHFALGGEKSRQEYLRLRTDDARQLARFFFGRLSLVPSFVIPLCLLPWALGKRNMRLVAAILLLSLGTSMATNYLIHPHYLAPVVPLFLLLVVESLRRLRVCLARRWAIGPALFRGLVLAQPACLAVVIAAHALVPPPTAWNRVRAELVSRLESAPGKSLVIVRYGPGHDSHQEWVSNAADIDASKVVWAHDLGVEKNRELLEYFPDRRVWLLEPEAAPPRLEKYNPELAAGRCPEDPAADRQQAQRPRNGLAASPHRQGT